MATLQPGGLLFVYGSLMFEEVQRAVLGRVCSSDEAVLPGYGRYCVHGHVFPGIRPHPRAAVQGLLLREVTPDELVALDVFEDDYYSRRTVTVRTSAGEESVMTYVIAERFAKRLSSQSWDPLRFADQHLHDFVATLVNPAG